MRHPDKTPSLQSPQSLQCQGRQQHSQVLAIILRIALEDFCGVEGLRRLNHQTNLRQAMKKHNSKAYSRNLNEDFQGNNDVRGFV